MESIPKNVPLLFPEIGYLRGLAIIAVITTHITTYYIKMPTITNLTLVYMIFIVLARYGVPLFLLVSGFVLYNKYNEKFDLNDFYRKRYMSIVPPYIIFSVLYEIWNRGVVTKALITDLLTGGANQHLWFIVLIVEIYLAYPIIMHTYNYFKNHRKAKYFLVTAFFINIVYNTYMQSYWFIPNMLGFLFYFVLGMYIRDNHELIDRKIISKNYWLFIITVMFIGTAYSIIELENTYFSTSILPNLMNVYIFRQLLYLLHCTALTVLVCYISMFLYRAKKAKFFSVLGLYSFGIYLIHARIVLDVMTILYKQGISVNNILFYPCTFMVTLMVSLAVVVILKQLPGHEYIIGKT
jgi:probable poly-beta-1,6-N-acetyl-D-glucosamine export protein